MGAGRRADTIHDSKEGAKPGIVPPTVDVLVVDDGTFREAVNGELRETGLSRPRRAKQQCCLAVFSPQDRVERAGERVHLLVPVSDLLGNELVSKDAHISNHTRYVLSAVV